MSNYRRLISYIYAYEGGIKGKNIGFAKIETRGIQCKITVSAKRIYVGGNDIGVYLLAGEQEIFLGNIFVRGGSGEFRTTVSANDVEHSGINMDQCFGLTVHDVKSTWRSYTTIWEDAVAHAAEVDLENTASAAREKDQAAVSEEQIKRAVQEIEEEFPLESEEAAHSEFVRPEQELAENDNSKVQAESGEISGESLLHETTTNEESEPVEVADDGSGFGEMASEEPALREMASEESSFSETVSEEAESRNVISEEINKEAISQETTGEGLPNGSRNWGDMAGESLPGESLSNEVKAAETLNSEALTNGEPADKNRMGGEESINEESVNEESVNEESINKESISEEPVIEAQNSDGSGMEKVEWNKPEEPEQPVNHPEAFASSAAPRQFQFSPTTGPASERRPLPRQLMSGWRQRNQPSALRSMPGGQPLNRPTAQGLPPMGQPLTRPTIPGVPPTGQPFPHLSTPASSGQPSLNQQNAAQEAGTPQPVEMTFGEPNIPQSSQDTAGSTVCYQADAVIKEAPDSGTAKPPLGNPDELERLLQTEEAEEISQDVIWEKLKHGRTRILAFDYEDGCEILTIKPQDIGILPRDAWVFGNNSFLLHGYYNYRYLILAKLLNPQGDPRYILGIPGHFYSNERYMASMFGFPNFVLSKEQPVEDGRFGFWYTDIKLGG